MIGEDAGSIPVPRDYLFLTFDLFFSSMSISKYLIGCFRSNDYFNKMRVGVSEK